MSIELPGLIYPEVLRPVLKWWHFRVKYGLCMNGFNLWEEMTLCKKFSPAMALDLMLNHMLESHRSSLNIVVISIARFFFSYIPVFKTWSPVQCDVTCRCGPWQTDELRLAERSPSQQKWKEDLFKSFKLICPDFNFGFSLEILLHLCLLEL